MVQSPAAVGLGPPTSLWDFAGCGENIFHPREGLPRYRHRGKKEMRGRREAVEHCGVTGFSLGLDGRVLHVLFMPCCPLPKAWRYYY